MTGDWRQEDLIVQSADMALMNVAALAQSGALDLSPRFQRRNRWGKDQQSKLIESFLMNVPVPPVYLAEERRGRFAVIDGKQRLTAIAQYLNGEYRLNNLTFATELEGLAFDHLPPTITSTLNMRPLRAVTVMRQTADWVKYEVFLRLNTGGQPLNAQEIRNVAFAGPLNDAIIDLSENKLLRSQLKIRSGASAAYADMSDVEFVLRYMALADTWQNFRGNLRATLDNFMLENHTADPKAVAGFAHRFNRAIRGCEALWGKLAFRRYDGKQWRDQMIGGVYDAQMVAVDQLSNGELEAAIRSERSVAAITKLFTDADFDSSVRIATNTPSRVRGRITAVRDLLLELG